MTFYLEFWRWEQELREGNRKQGETTAFVQVRQKMKVVISRMKKRQIHELSGRQWKKKTTKIFYWN